jgi:hypothetical protein
MSAEQEEGRTSPQFSHTSPGSVRVLSRGELTRTASTHSVILSLQSLQSTRSVRNLWSPLWGDRLKLNGTRCRVAGVAIERKRANDRWTASGCKGKIERREGTVKVPPRRNDRLKGKRVVEART